MVRIFSNGWIDCKDAFRAVLHLQRSVKISEYEAYTKLTDFLLINSWACTKKEL